MLFQYKNPVTALWLVLFFFMFPLFPCRAQLYKPADSLATACTDNPARSWWDVLHYELSVDFTDTITGSISGSNKIIAKLRTKPFSHIQIDLDDSLDLEAAFFRGQQLKWEKIYHAYFLSLPVELTAGLSVGDTFSLDLKFGGKPREAKNAPWDGGFVRQHDSSGQLWWAVACQGQGASLWFPCKNFQGDEPDLGVTEHYTIPEGLTAIGNGRLIGKKKAEPAATTYTWQVQNSINNYDITFYIGDYVHWTDTFQGQKGRLDLSFYALKEQEQTARKQFSQVKTMLSCFENHFGAYPFYEDGYKLVEAPYLGMEHQSAVAYGNHFQQGYLGKDRSATGVGLLFDFIIVHESAHEWFGNSITAFDKADGWIHEGFASYAETVYAECIAGKEKAFEYQQGKRRTIQNDKAVEGREGQCDEGSSDAYDKAGFMLHMIRVLMDNDTAFFNMLKEMNRKYEHQLVTGAQIESFISAYTQIDFTKLFDQYLRESDLPVLMLQKYADGTLHYYWENCVPDFNIPVYWLDGEEKQWLYPQTTPQNIPAKNLKNIQQIISDFLIDVHWVE